MAKFFLVDVLIAVNLDVLSARKCQPMSSVPLYSHHVIMSYTMYTSIAVLDTPEIFLVTRVSIDYIGVQRDILLIFGKIEWRCPETGGAAPLDHYLSPPLQYTCMLKRLAAVE